MEAEKAQQLAILGDAVASFLVEVGLFRNVGLTGPELLLGLQDATATMKIQAAQLEAVMRVPTDYRAELAELYRDGGERIPFAMSTAALIRTRMDQKYEELARG